MLQAAEHTAAVGTDSFSDLKFLFVRRNHHHRTIRPKRATNLCDQRAKFVVEQMFHGTD